MPHLSYCSTRVTVVTCLARAEIQERVVMLYVGDASATVHGIYTRLKVEDLSSCIKALAHLMAYRR